MEKEVNELCEILDDYKITADRDMPEEAWNRCVTFLMSLLADFMYGLFRCKKQGFFGMIIPKQYGGKGFSPHAHSQVVQKLSTRSSSVAATVSVPNSLGNFH